MQSLQYDYIPVPSHTSCHRSNQVTNLKLVNKLQVRKIFFFLWCAHIICFIHLFQFSGQNFAVFYIILASLMLPQWISVFLKHKICLSLFIQWSGKMGRDWYAIIFIVGLICSHFHDGTIWPAIFFHDFQNKVIKFDNAAYSTSKMLSDPALKSKLIKT